MIHFWSPVTFVKPHCYCFFNLFLYISQSAAAHAYMCLCGIKFEDNITGHQLF